MFRRRSSAEEVRFSEAAQRALSFAREEAARLGHDRVGAEHQLLGVLRADEGPVTDLLDRLDTRVEVVREAVESRIPAGSAMEISGGDTVPFDSRAKKAIEFAMSEARELRDRVIRPDHLLLGLLREGSGEGAAVLNEHGVTLARARSALRSVRSPGAPDVFRIRIDTSGASIYDQIIGRVQEAVATGELQPGDRLPPVRGLAERLGVAPGTVGRAYGELERLGIVITQGARGTRVAGRRAPAIPHLDLAGTLVGLLRPAVVAAFHLGATAADLRGAFERAMSDIFGDARNSRS